MSLIKIFGKEPTDDADCIPLERFFLTYDTPYNWRAAGSTLMHSAAHMTFSMVSKAASMNSSFSTTLR